MRHYIMWKSWLLLLMSVAVGHAADACNINNVSGPYAFQLSGMTTISGDPQPTVGLGRIVFQPSDGFGDGTLSGTSSVTFSGLLLGNPVTGSYEVKTDCSITWQLQDDSGAYQHFSGKLSPDLIRVPFSQTDPGGLRGIMEKTPDSCTSTDLLRKYNFTVSGSTKAMLPGQTGHDVNARGALDTTRDGNFQVDSDCTVHFVLTLPSEPQPMTMRGFLVDGGKEILGFQTDPGAMVAARLTVDTK
jgi:hypothetical protein